MKITEIQELKKLKGEGWESAVGEYTPAEFWDAIESLEKVYWRLLEIKHAEGVDEEGYAFQMDEILKDVFDEG